MRKTLMACCMMGWFGSYLMADGPPEKLSDAGNLLGTPVVGKFLQTPIVVGSSVLGRVGVGVPANAQAPPVGVVNGIERRSTDGSEDRTAGGDAYGGVGDSSVQCLCGKDFSGGGFCFEKFTPCEGLQRCPEGDCPEGFRCLVESCCGEPVCSPQECRELDCDTPGTCRNFEDCVFVFGACCTVEACFGETTKGECMQLSGEFFPEQSCEDVDFCEGACCVFSNSCFRVDQGTCDFLGGVFQGVNTSCPDQDIDCPAPTGACCLFAGDSCDEITEFRCLLWAPPYSVYQGDGVSCDDVECPVGPCPGRGGDCCSPHNSFGCENESCCEAVCAVDPMCCFGFVGWNAACVKQAEELCGNLCGPCTGNETLDVKCKAAGCGNKLTAIMDSGPPGVTVTFCIDGGDCKKKTVNSRGVAKVKWCPVASGAHTIEVIECGLETQTDCP